MSKSNEKSFIMLPRSLIYDACYSHISVTAKYLYAFLLDRMSLSKKNGWKDKDGRTYVICTIEEVQELLHVGNQKAIALLNELKKNGLIEKKRQGLGKPNLIYVNECKETPKEDNRKPGIKNVMKSVNETPEIRESESEDIAEAHTNHINNNHNNNSYTESYPFTSFREENTTRQDANERGHLKEIIKDNIDYDILTSDPHTDRDLVNELLDIILDVVCSTSPYIRVSRDNKPTEVVRDTLMRLNSEHIQFVIDSMKKNTSEVRNIRQYLITSLYNAPMTIGNYYQSLVNHDMYGT